MNVPFSRHFSYPDGELGSDIRRPSVDRKLISMLDKEQLSREPSSREWWNQRKEGLMRVSDDQNMCPCLADIFRRQSEQLNKIISSSKSLDLTMAGKLDQEQLLHQRRVSIPLDRFVAILDDQQTRRDDSYNKEMMERVLKKMKNLKCKCEAGNLNVPKVNVIPCTPLLNQDGYDNCLPHNESTNISCHKRRKHHANKT